MSENRAGGSTVEVTKELLLEVLDQAQRNLRSTHGEFCDASGRHSCDEQQERIDTLRQEALTSERMSSERQAFERRVNGAF